jgi:hypothetical protein
MLILTSKLTSHLDRTISACHTLFIYPAVTGGSSASASLLAPTITLAAIATAPGPVYLLRALASTPAGLKEEWVPRPIRASCQCGSHKYCRVVRDEVRIPAEKS